VEGESLMYVAECALSGIAILLLLAIMLREDGPDG
jgi:hypothetical protein